MAEKWLSVVGFEGKYEVSDLGRVRSVDRTITFVQRGHVVSQRRKGQLLKSYTAKSGHVHLNLGVGNQRLVHRLVLDAFTGPCPEGQEGCHDDGKPGNNQHDNLRWDTHIANVNDQDIHGTRLRGSAKPETKLTETIVREIKSLRGLVSQANLAKRFGVGKSTVQAAMDGRTWRHV